MNSHQRRTIRRLMKQASAQMTSGDIALFLVSLAIGIGWPLMPNKTPTIVFLVSVVLFALCLQPILHLTKGKGTALRSLGVLGLLVVISGYSWFVWPELIFCYAFFVQSPDGKYVLTVANPTHTAARSVSLVLMDIPLLKQTPDPKNLQRIFIPIVYPYATGHNSGCAANPTQIVTETLSAEYQIELVSENGERTIEELKVTDKGQCAIVRRASDNSILAKSTPQFDRYGGCMKSSPCL